MKKLNKSVIAISMIISAFLPNLARAGDSNVENNGASSNSTSTLTKVFTEDREKTTYNVFEFETCKDVLESSKDNAEAKCRSENMMICESRSVVTFLQVGGPYGRDVTCAAHGQAIGYVDLPARYIFVEEVEEHKHTFQWQNRKAAKLYATGAAESRCYKAGYSKCTVLNVSFNNTTNDRDSVTATATVAGVL